MRFLLSTNALRPTVALGRRFDFEPVAIRGGTWLGVLAVEDDLAASILSERPLGVDEISPERYDILKKKLPAPQTVWPADPAQPSQGVTVAEPAASRTAQTAAAKPPVSEPVVLGFTDQLPPVEPLLAQPAAPNRGRKW